MTRSAGVGEQLVVALNIMTGRARGSAPQADSGIAQEDLGGKFSDLLTKLKIGGERTLDESAAVTPARGSAPAGGAAPAEWTEAPQRVRESWVGEEVAAADEKLAADYGLPASDNDHVDTSNPEAPSKTGGSNIPAVVESNADAAAAESMAAILTVSSGLAPAANAAAVSGRAVESSRSEESSQPAENSRPAERGQPTESSQPAENSQPAGRGASLKAIVEATLESGARAAGQVGPKAGHLTAKGEVRFGAAAAAFTLSSPAENATTPMSGIVVAPANDSPKANVLRQEAHFPPVALSTMHARGGASHMQGGNLGTGSETKHNESSALPIDTGSTVDTDLIAAEDPASGAVPSPTQQIASRITTKLGAFEVVDRVQAEPNQVATKPVLKVLQIQLQPVELGTVTVHMELGEAGLELQVEVASAETAEILRADKDTLSNLLRSSGYTVDASSIRVVEADRTAGSPQTGQQGAQPNLQSSTQPQYGGAERDARANRGNEGSSGGEASAQANRTESHETNASRIGGGLYI